MQQIENCFDSMISNHQTQLKKQLNYPVLMHFFPNQIQQKCQTRNKHKIFPKNYSFFNKYSTKHSLDCLQRLKNSNYHKSNKKCTLIHPIQSSISVSQYEIPSSIKQNRSKHQNSNIYNKKYQSGSMKSTPSTNFMPSIVEISSLKNIKTKKFIDNQSDISIQQDYMTRSSFEAETDKQNVQIQSKINPNSQIDRKSGSMSNFQEQTFKKLYKQVRSAEENKNNQYFYHKNDNSNSQISINYVQQQKNIPTRKNQNGYNNQNLNLLNKQTKKMRKYNVVQKKQQQNDITTINVQVQLYEKNKLFESFGVQNHNINAKVVNPFKNQQMFQQLGKIKDQDINQVDRQSQKAKLKSNIKQRKSLYQKNIDKQVMSQKKKQSEKNNNKRKQQKKQEHTKRSLQYIENAQTPLDYSQQIIKSQFLSDNQISNQFNQNNIQSELKKFSLKQQQKQILNVTSRFFINNLAGQASHNNWLCQNQQCMRIKDERDYLRKNFIDHLQKRHPQQISYKSYTLIKENFDNQSFVLSRYFVQAPTNIVITQAKRKQNQESS